MAQVLSKLRKASAGKMKESEWAELEEQLEFIEEL